MITTVVNKLKSFYNGDKGNVLVFVALILTPMLLMLGLAVDSSHGFAEKQRLQMACDAAAKAGAVNGGGVTATITSQAQRVFAANTANMTNITGPSISVNASANTVTVSASIVVSNNFMTLGGVPTTSYSTSTTWALPSTSNAEVAIVYEVSERFLTSNFHQNICTALINFVNNLPSNVMVSITPIATEILLNASNTNPSNLFNLLSSTTNDESATPALFPLSPNYPWTNANYSAVANPFYLTGYYGATTASPNVLMSNLAPITCTFQVPTPFPSCSPTTWPTNCPTGHASCSQYYSYQSNTAFPILPLTLNRTAIVSYLTNLSAFSTAANGMFPSLISWGWRTIDPNWKNFWQTNSNLTSPIYTTGTYPKPYGGVQKSMIVIMNDTAYWSEYIPNLASTGCCNISNGVNNYLRWWVTPYGILSVPTDYYNGSQGITDRTCENRWYNTIDNTLGLGLTVTPGYFEASVASSTYQTDIINAVNAKFLRICNNIKSEGVNIYLMAANDIGLLSPCCNTSANAYTIGNSVTSVETALNAISAKIVAIVK